MLLPLDLVKRINEEAYKEWTTSSSIASRILSQCESRVLKEWSTPTVSQIDSKLRKSFRPLLPLETTTFIEKQIGPRQFTNFFVACCDLYFSGQRLGEAVRQPENRCKQGQQDEQ